MELLNDKMNISIFTDLRFTASDKPTGVGKHILQMVEGLKYDHKLNILGTKDQLDDSGNIPPINRLCNLDATRLPLSWKISNGLWALANGPSLDSYCQDVDWVYCPKNDFIPLRRTKLAITIHGAYELDPDVPKQYGFKAKINRVRSRLSYKRIIEQADLILTVSQFLKQKIVECFSADPSKIVVVGNGVEPLFFDSGRESHSENAYERVNPYLLCVGGLNTIDGGNEILATARELKNCLPDMRLLVAGWQHEANLLEEAKKLPNIVMLGYVEAQKLANLMKDAVALLYLTRYETFGIAAAEAMAVGTPVLTAGGTAVPEIVGDAGLYVLREPEDIITNIKRLLDDEKLRINMIVRGHERAQSFTWHECVSRLIIALESKRQINNINM